MYKIFFNNLTCLDHGFIDDKGFLRGGSFHVNVVVSAKELSTDDFTVIDFSYGKKQIKQLIDSMEIGYDHKTWIIPNWSLIDSFDGKKLITPTLTMKAPSTAFRVFDNADCYSDISKELKIFLEANMIEFQFDIECVESCLTDKPYNTFRYVHGLASSKKSIGCQNIGHGHLSYISIPDKTLQEKIADDLNNSIFVFDRNCVNGDKDWLLYTTEQRGEFELKLISPEYKIIKLPVESTIENISRWIRSTYSLDEGQLFVSEGLSKGAIA
jgi:hypothetical protein